MYWWYVLIWAGLVGLFLLLELLTGTLFLALLGAAAILSCIAALIGLNIWWQISGIFGGGLLGLFILSLLKVKLKPWQGIIAIKLSILVIGWGTLARDLPESWQWAQCNIDGIIVGAVGTAVLMAVALVFDLMNRNLWPSRSR